MQPIQPCNSYHARVRDREIWPGPDDRSVFKLYYVDIIGRDHPERYEWDKAPTSKEALRNALETTAGVEGIGFITAFPHITKVFRFGPETETVLNVRAWRTEDMQPLDLARSDGYVEYACLAEAMIAADEYALWAEATTVDAYLKEWSAYSNAPIAAHHKLKSYWS